MKLLGFTIMIALLGCQSEEKKRNDEKPKNKNVTSESGTSKEDRRVLPSDWKYVGDPSLCSIYSRMAAQNKIVLDEFNGNPLKDLRVSHRVNFTVKIEECLSRVEDVYCKNVILKNGMEICFMKDNHSNDELLTVVNDELFSVRKLFGEMFTEDSELHFFYDDADLYKLSNGNLLMVEQPSSWCGTANVFDFYQYFDLTKGEVVQFVEKDSFIEYLYGN